MKKDLSSGCVDLAAFKKRANRRPAAPHRNNREPQLATLLSLKEKLEIRSLLYDTCTIRVDYDDVIGLLEAGMYPYDERHQNILEMFIEQAQRNGKGIVYFEARYIAPEDNQTLKQTGLRFAGGDARNFWEYASIEQALSYALTLGDNQSSHFPIIALNTEVSIEGYCAIAFVDKDNGEPPYIQLMSPDATPKFVLVVRRIGDATIA
ncbi:MAG: hypothetical protein WAN50_04460 [Minisyncoccia bacterium]